MGTYHRFEEGDILHSIIHAAPKVIMASGTAGWRGNVGPSSSLSLYGGIRSRRNVRSVDYQTSGLSIYPLDELDTHSIDKTIFISGSYPATGSIQMVTVRNTVRPSLTSVTSVDWYEEHFRPLEILFDYYSRFRPDFFIGAYDFKSLYLNQNVPYSAPAVIFSGTSLSTFSSSFSAEIRVKPTRLTGSSDFTLQSQRGRWKFFITGSNGTLAFSDFRTTITSSSPLALGMWQHVGMAVGNNSASFYVDGDLIGGGIYTGTLIVSTSSLVVGGELVISGSSTKVNNGFGGFLYESRLWSSKKTAAQMSASSFSTLENPSASDLVHYVRFNDGPLSTRHGFSSGSGAFDYGQFGIHGKFLNVGTTLPLSPIWQPNDDISFSVEKTEAIGTPTVLRVLHVPSMFYGRQIETGSIKLTCNAYDRQGIVRNIVDDGKGNLYLSGSITQRLSGEDFKGVSWNKVGNVFYSEGLIVITDPSLLDFGSAAKDWSGNADPLQIKFSGDQRILTKVFMCRLGAGKGNASNNPTFTKIDPTDQLEERLVIARPEPITYITSIGLYDEKRNLVGVAKLAQPIRKREKDKINIRIRVDI